MEQNAEVGILEKVRKEPVKGSLKENIKYLKDALGVEKALM